MCLNLHNLNITLFLQAKVVRTKSTESMPFLFSFMMVIVSFLWLCYGIAVEDVNIQVKMPICFPFEVYPGLDLGGVQGVWSNPVD